MFKLDELYLAHRYVDTVFNFVSVAYIMQHRVQVRTPSEKGRGERLFL